MIIFDDETKKQMEELTTSEISIDDVAKLILDTAKNSNIVMLGEDNKVRVKVDENLIKERIKEL